MNNHKTKLAIFIGTALISSSALAQGDEAPWVGDPVNGEKLFKKECAACHGDDGKGGRVGVSLHNSGRLSWLRDSQVMDIVTKGEGVKRPDEHKFAKKLKFLQRWDVIAHVRSLHMEMHDFFPNASRYVSGQYTVDKFGLERIKEATGKDLEDKTAYVFTFFSFEGEEGNLQFIPNDPILLDQLKKKMKTGYLVFLPFATQKFEGEIGIAMDKKGVIKRISVHRNATDGGNLNRSLKRFRGQGKKGQSQKFKVSGGKAVKDLADDVFRVYMRAMETVTMYDRDENERTWADEE